MAFGNGIGNGTIQKAGSTPDLTGIIHILRLYQQYGTNPLEITFKSVILVAYRFKCEDRLTGQGRVVPERKTRRTLYVVFRRGM